jgi:serine/threonine-protein kinase
MSLTTGSKIGPYEVIGPIGVGGMGEVFRARDTRLKRDVALIVLPAAALQDHDRRARFEREAQVLASLNHTSIAQVFGVELDGDAMVIVMELVEGATLADRMAKGALPIDDALAIACEICDGLEAAHERGIVHRDLKPANIKVRPDGTIKILDFGIARVLTDERAVDAANSPTMLNPRTDSGFILGTAAYMSPEQARGRGVDRRADIWAFGCVLYEMLTGTRVFPGESVADILAAIISKEPDWSKLPAAVSPRIRELLRRCLEKNPKDRLRDAGDARYEIQHANALAAGPAAKPASNLSRLIPMWLAAGVFLGAGTVALFVPMFSKTSPAPLAPVRSVIQLPANTSLALSRGSVVAISPDGNSVIFIGRKDGTSMLYVRRLDSFETKTLPGTEDATNPFFSPDGRWVGFFSKDKLRKVSLDGGAPVAIADAPNPRGEAWGPDGNIYVTPANNTPISKVSELGGALAVETGGAQKKGQLSHRWPFVLPDGKALLYTIWNDLGWEPAQTVAQQTGASDQRILLTGGGYPHYLRDEGRQGFLVYARSEGLMAARFNEASLALTSQPLPLGENVVTNLSGGAHFDLSASGTLAYVPGAIGEADRDLAWVSLDGKRTPIASIHGLSRNWSLSPDGTRIVRNNTVGAVRDLWIDNLATISSTRLESTDSGFNGGAIWMPDGKSIVFTRDAPYSNLNRRGTDIVAPEARLTNSTTPQVPTSVSPDGKYVLFTSFDPSTGSDIWVLSLDDKSTRPFVKTSFIEGTAKFSPDGKWVVYQSNDTGRFEVFVRPFPAGEPLYRVSHDGGISQTWAPSGREIYYRSVTGAKVMAAPVNTASGFSVGAPRVLFDGAAYEPFFEAAPDGKRLLMMPLISTEQAATQINLVQNFISELRARIK